MNYNTDKLYYQDPNLLQNETLWSAAESRSEIAIVASCAFPEGGGQLGDQGIITQNGVSVRFFDTQKCGFGRTITRQDFPVIHVEQEIHLKLDGHIPPEWRPDQPVTVAVDGIRRKALSRSHTAAHLLWLGLTEEFGNLYPVVRGCYIATNHGRFDVLIPSPTDGQMERVNTFITEWVVKDYEIEMKTLDGEPECRIWRCGGRDIPCGGTHLKRTGNVGNFILRKKSKGKSGHRIIYEFADFCDKAPGLQPSE